MVDSMACLALAESDMHLVPVDRMRVLARVGAGACVCLCACAPACACARVCAPVHEFF